MTDAHDNALIRHEAGWVVSDDLGDANPGLGQRSEAAINAEGEQMSKPDCVNHPDHYQSEFGIECIDAIRAALGDEGFVSHCRGTAIKYAWRSGKKSNHAEDLRKAAWYLAKAAEVLEQ